MLKRSLNPEIDMQEELTMNISTWGLLEIKMAKIIQQEDALQEYVKGSFSELNESRPQVTVEPNGSHGDDGGRMARPEPETRRAPNGNQNDHEIEGSRTALPSVQQLTKQDSM